MKREMKRSKASSPSPEDAHASKRQKLSDDSDGQDSDSAGQWTKVEKRKSKKHKKMETKYDVCLPLHLPQPFTYSSLSCSSARQTLPSSCMRKAKS